MKQLTKNPAVATSQEAVQNQNEPQLRDENAHNDKSVHVVLNPTYPAELYPLSLHDALPISLLRLRIWPGTGVFMPRGYGPGDVQRDRKSTRLNSSHVAISYAVFCLKKKMFRIRMSRNFGMKMLTMTNLSTECLIQLTKLGYD